MFARQRRLVPALSSEAIEKVAGGRDPDTWYDPVARCTP